MTEMAQHITRIEAEIHALEQEQSRLEAHLVVLNEADQIRLKYDAGPKTAKTVDVHRSEARDTERKPENPRAVRSEVQEERELAFEMLRKRLIGGES